MLPKQDDIEVELRERVCHAEWCGTPSSYEISRVWCGGFDVTSQMSDEEMATIGEAIQDEGIQ